MNCFVDRFFYSNNKKILSLEFFLDLSVILRKILRIFLNTGPVPLLRVFLTDLMGTTVAEW